ncbi:alanine racemase, partial [Dietzia maris]
SCDRWHAPLARAPARRGGVGSPGVRLGLGAGGAPTAAEWARTVGTIHYEVVTAVRGRAERHHVLRASYGADRGREAAI